MLATAQHAKLPTEEAEVMDGLDKSAEVHGGVRRAESAVGCWAGCSAINPETSLLRMAWDAFLTISCLYTLFCTLVRIVFMEPEESAKVETDSMWTTILVVLWTVDIAVQFRTAYRDTETGQMVSSFWPVHVKQACTEASGQLAADSDCFKRGIALRYVTRFLIFDLLAVAPCIYARVVASAAHELPEFFQGGGSRIFKVVILTDSHFFEHGFRRFIHTLFRRLEEQYGWDHWSYDYSRSYYMIDKSFVILQQAIAFFAAVHVSGTIWYIMGEDDDSRSWIAAQGWNAGTPETTMWLRAVYWSSTTLTTVGYGDISATTNPEMIYTVCAMAAGVLFQSWLIGNVSKAIDRATIVDDQHKMTMARVQDYMKSKYMPHELCQRVLEYQQKKFENDRYFGIHEFVRDLPPQLEFEMLNELYIKKLSRCQCFAGFPPLIMIELCRHIKIFPVTAGMELFKPGDAAREAYIINCGLYDSNCKIRMQEEGKRDIELTDGDMVGANALSFGAQHAFRKNCATVLADGDLLLIPRESVIHVHNTFPVANVKEHIERFIEFRNKQKVSLELGEDDSATQTGWAPWQPSAKDERTTHERLDQMEGDIQQIKTMLETIIQR